LLFEPDMILRRGLTCAALALTGLLALSGCTGGTEGSAAEEKAPQKNPIAQETQSQPQAQPQADPRQELKSINHAIPIYAGAKFREDLTHRDAVMVRNQYGPQAEVFTLATDDSFPQVYHYYTTYLAQFRAFPAKPPIPPDQDWRTLEVQLNQAMQEPFIPGDTFKPGDKQVTLQVVETEAEPKTVIRYIVTPASPTGSQLAVGSSQ
jgi:hypothetical protein